MSLNSRDHTYSSLIGTAYAEDGEIPGVSVGAWVLARQTEGTTTVAVAYTSWESVDSTNYLAGGYWVTGVDDGAGGVDLDLGAFFDWGAGSIFNHGDSWTKPTTGTAAYTGAAQGTYLYEGTENDLGIWTGGLKLDADFNDGTISGGVESIYHYSALSDLEDGEGIGFDGSVTLGGAPIADDGTFKGTLSIVGPDITSSSGNWGGVFSDNDDADTTPDWVGGTLGGTFEDDGGEGAFVGVFVGANE